MSLSTEPPVRKRTPLEDVPVDPYDCYQAKNVKDSAQFYTAPVRKIGLVVMDVVCTEGPVHFHEIARRTAEAWDMQQAGKMIKARVNQALKALRKADKIVANGDFYWPTEMRRFPVRRRNGDDVRADVDLIALEELTSGLRLLLKHRSPLLPDELVTETARIFGFSRTGSKLRERIELAKNGLIEQGEIRIGGTGLYLADDA